MLIVHTSWEASWRGNCKYAWDKSSFVKRLPLVSLANSSSMRGRGVRVRLDVRIYG